MAVIIVNTSADDNAANGVTSLREALAVAAGTAEADTIVFAAGISRIFLTSNGGPLVIAAGQNVTIDGDRNNDGVADVTIDSQTSTNHFIVQAGATARLEGLVLTNGAVFGATGVVGVQGAVGAKGQDGADGDTADAGANGTNGLAGGVGGVGGAGGAGAGSIFNLGALTLAQTQVVGNVGYGGLAGKGGTGGTGGEGGDGGRGGDAPEIFFFPGGPGGFAGDGGTGGKGGAGGTGGAGAGAIVQWCRCDASTDGYARVPTMSAGPARVGPEEPEAQAVAPETAAMAETAFRSVNPTTVVTARMAARAEGRHWRPGWNWRHGGGRHP